MKEQTKPVKEDEIEILLACPFCGGESEIEQTGRNRMRVGCANCVLYKEQKVIHQSLNWLKLKLIENWNQRTGYAAAQKSEQLTPVGLRWVKASERLPEVSETLIWRFLDKSHVNMGYSKKGFEFMDRHYLKSDEQIEAIEWLDETPTPLEAGTAAAGLYTQKQIDYVAGVSDENLRGHLLHQVRLRDNMEADRDSFEKQLRESRIPPEAGKEAIEFVAVSPNNTKLVEGWYKDANGNNFQLIRWNQAKQATPVKRDEQEMKRLFAEHLGLKPGEELNTTDAYAVEWVLKNIV